MATAGLSLVGFMEQQQAIDHLRKNCVFDDVRDGSLAGHWQSAKAKCAGVVDRAGLPEISDLPPEHQAHIEAVKKQERPKELPEDALFKLVEIAPLLAFQFLIETNRSASHCGDVKNPSIADMLPICLPLNPREEPIKVHRNPRDENAMMIIARTPNFFVEGRGRLDDWTVGIRFGLPLPFVHVVRHNGKCYLHNGFHRAYGLAVAGATHIPCLFRDVKDHDAVGIKDGLTFSARVLESQNPPTLAHYTQGRAFDVKIKSVTQIVHVKWATYTIEEEQP